MRLYAGTSKNFIKDAVHNQIAGKLSDAFFRHYRYKPAESEIRSWRNSLGAISGVFQDARLDDHGVILEFQLPLTSRRLDCLVCGKDGSSDDNAVVIELKQWERCRPALGDNLVSTWLNGSERDTLHPSAQVGQYHQYLAENHTAFYDGTSPIKLNSCAYLHNYHAEDDDHLFAPSFQPLIEQYPSFTADDVAKLKEFLLTRLDGGDGLSVLQRIEESRYRPSKKLMQHVSNVIRGSREYVLLDEQYVVYNKVLACAREGFINRRKTVLIVKGGPGTGKSVIAINLMGDLLREELNTHYATGSKAFTETLRKIIGLRGSSQFKYFNSYAQACANEIDVLICDEAHRIRETSNSRFTAKEQRSTKSQINEILDAAKVSVFFIDDKQVVRPNEIGSADFIKGKAEQNGCRVFEYQLEAQFRCAGSEGFVGWVNNTLGVERTANVIWEGDENFEFRIFSSPLEMEAAIRQKAAAGFSARMTAGFCWPWSKPKHDGTLVDDVQVGEYKRPWNAAPEACRLAPGIPKASLWAHEPGGVNQIGCIYTAQGFEFDYVGIIFGLDLTYNLDTQSWEGNPEKSNDVQVKRAKGAFIDLAKNTYRVLLSRGMKGCYVHFMDKDTERFFRSRMEVAPGSAEVAQSLGQKVETVVLPFKKPSPAEIIRVPSPESLPMVAEAPATYGDAIIDRILAAMQPGREYARADLVEPLGLTTGQWNAAIQELKRRGKVRQIGERRGARYELVKAEGGGR